jgi:hypothetical protein
LRSTGVFEVLKLSLSLLCRTKNKDISFCLYLHEREVKSFYRGQHQLTGFANEAINYWNIGAENM